jgi:hypothetical protein
MRQDGVKETGRENIGGCNTRVDGDLERDDEGQSIRKDCE